MKRKIVLVNRKKGPVSQTKQKVFTTIDEVGLHFFRKKQSKIGVLDGKERGARAAKKAFIEIAKALVPLRDAEQRRQESRRAKI